MKLRAFVPTSVAVLTILSATSALAAPNARDKQQAQALVVEAKKLTTEGDLKKALNKLKKAQQLAPQSTTLIELAKVETDLGDFVAALAALEEAVAAPAMGYHEKRAQLDAQKLLDGLKVRTPKLSIDVAKPAAGKVTLSLDEEDTEPGTHRVNPGKHELVAKAKGFAEWSKTIRLDEGEEKSFTIKMKASGDEDESDSTGGGGAVPRWAAWTSWGVTAAAIGVGAGFGVMAIQTTNQVLADYGCSAGKCPSSASADLDIAKFNGNVSTASFAIAGAGLVTSTVLSVFAFSKSEAAAEEGASKNDESAAVSVMPVAGPGFLGVAGTF